MRVTKPPVEKKIGPFGLDNKKDIKDFLRIHYHIKVKEMVIHDDLTVDLLDGFSIEFQSRLPVIFNHVKGFLDCRMLKDSMIGSPRVCEGYFCVRSSPTVTTLEGIPEKVVNLFLDGTGITSLKGIHKLVKQVSGGRMSVPRGTTDSMLGLLLIPRLGLINEFSAHSKQLAGAVEILNKHLRRDKDVLECQEELIRAGLNAFAKL